MRNFVQCHTSQTGGMILSNLVYKNIMVMSRNLFFKTKNLGDLLRENQNVFSM